MRLLQRGEGFGDDDTHEVVGNGEGLANGLALGEAPEGDLVHDDEDGTGQAYEEDENYVERMERRIRLEGRAARQQTLEALRRYQQRERGARTPGRGSRRRSPNSVSSPSASPDAVLRSRALPGSPPAAQPDLIPRPVYDDVGVVGVLEAPPRARAVEVVRDLVVQTYVHDLVHIQSMGAYFWEEVQEEQDPSAEEEKTSLVVQVAHNRGEIYKVTHVLATVCLGGHDR